MQKKYYSVDFFNENVAVRMLTPPAVRMLTPHAVRMLTPHAVRMLTPAVRFFSSDMKMQTHDARMYTAAVRMLT